MNTWRGSTVLTPRIVRFFDGLCHASGPSHGPPDGASGNARGGSLRDVERRHAAQLAAMRLVVERTGAMHRRAVVPDDEVAHTPAVPVDPLPLRRVLHQ